MIKKKLILGISIMTIGVLCCLGLTSCADTKLPTEPEITPPTTSAPVEIAPMPITEAEQQEQVLAMLQEQRGETGEVVLVKMGTPYGVTNVLTEYAGETYSYYGFLPYQSYLPDELNARLEALDRRNFTIRDEYDFGVVDGWLVFPKNENAPRWCVDLEQETVFDVLLQPNPKHDRTEFMLLRDETIAAEYYDLLLEIKCAWESYVEELRNSQYLIEGSVIESQKNRVKLRGTAARNDGADTVTGLIWVELWPETDSLSANGPGDWVEIHGYRAEMPHITDDPKWSDYTCFESTGKADQQVYLDGIQALNLVDVNYRLSFWSDAEQTTAPNGIVITPTYVDELGVVHGGYYSLTLPESWAESVEYEVVPGEGYTYSVSFYHKPDRVAGMGGHLFTLRLILDLIVEEEGYSHLPSYERLGHLDVYRITGGDLVAVYPTDVQFDVETAAAYQARTAEIDGVLASLTFSAEATFTE